MPARAAPNPRRGGLGRRSGDAGGAIGANGPGRAPPHGIVIVLGSHERMRDLVQEGLPHEFLGIQRHQVPRNADRGILVTADARAALRVIEGEAPLREQPVGAHQLVRECFNVVQIHRGKSRFSH